MEIDDELIELQKGTKKLLDSIGSGGVGLYAAVHSVGLLETLVKKGIFTKEEQEEMGERAAGVCTLIEAMYKKQLKKK